MAVEVLAEDQTGHMQIGAWRQEVAGAIHASEVDAVDLAQSGIKPVLLLKESRHQSPGLLFRRRIDTVVAALLIRPGEGQGMIAGFAVNQGTEQTGVNVQGRCFLLQAVLPVRGR
jgi:hypothetical protein